MRTKRAQKRRSRLVPTPATRPDPFGDAWPHLVDAEEAVVEACPCCEERLWDFQDVAYALATGDTTVVRPASPTSLEEALWVGDVDWLDEHYHCGCCCHEHTFEGCPARLWGGCRGQGTTTRSDHESWADFYQRTRGMSREEFFR